MERRGSQRTTVFLQRVRITSHTDVRITSHTDVRITSHTDK